MNKLNYLSELKAELSLERDFESSAEAVLLSYLLTSQRINRLAYEFFRQYDLSDVQFNVLIFLWDHRHKILHQWELADLLLVNRASAGGVVDRMVSKGLVQRMQDQHDRRALRVSLTSKGVNLLKKVKPSYYHLINQSFDGLNPFELIQFIRYLSHFRTSLDRLNSKYKSKQL